MLDLVGFTIWPPLICKYINQNFNPWMTLAGIQIWSQWFSWRFVPVGRAISMTEDSRREARVKKIYTPPGFVAPRHFWQHRGTAGYASSSRTSNFKAFVGSLWPLWLLFSDAPIKFPNCGTMQQRARITKRGRFNVGAGITNKGNVWETLHLWNRAHGSSTRDVYVWNGTIYIDKKWIKQKTKKEANLPKLKWPEMYDPLASLNNPCSSEDHGCAAKPPKTLQETFDHKNQIWQTKFENRGNKCGDERCFEPKTNAHP